jgi:HD-like signal output (HDOD) protein
MSALPPVPALYLELQQVLSKRDGGIDEVGKLVERDAALSAKVLQLVNSAFFGLARPVTSAAEATRYLGLDTITALILTPQVFNRVEGLGSERLELLWKHCECSAAYSRAIARAEGCDRRSLELAFLAGMLHDVGLILFMNDMPDELDEAWKYARRQGLSSFEGERRVIGANHAALGGYLLGIWGLPDSVVQTIAFHHEPAKLPNEGFSTLTAVHVGTSLDCSPGGSALGETAEELDTGYLEQVGLAQRLPVWRKECERLTDRRAA